MKEFIDKLIEKLEEEHERCINRYGIVGGNASAMEVKQCIEIVNELAEEHAKTPTTSHPIPIDTQQYIEQLESRDKVTVELTDREREVLNTNLSAEIMKMQFHYGNSVPERLQVLYNLRDKLCHKEDKK